MQRTPPWEAPQAKVIQVQQPIAPTQSIPSFGSQQPEVRSDLPVALVPNIKKKGIVNCPIAEEAVQAAEQPPMARIFPLNKRALNTMKEIFQKSEATHTKALSG